MQVDSKVLWDPLQALEELGRGNMITLAWVPGHEGHIGNEEASSLAGASKALFGLEPLCGLTRTSIKDRVNQWMLHKSRMVEYLIRSDKRKSF